MNQNQKLKPALAALIVIVLIGIVATAAIIVNNNTSDTATTPMSSSMTDTATNTMPTASTDTSSYKDGTYSATGTYLTPGGRESIGLTVIIKDGVITDTTLEEKATDRDASMYQDLFGENYKELVVGKDVHAVSLSRVAGSSLTSNGFNDALNQIKDEARA